MINKKHTIIYLDVDGVINALSKRPPKDMTGWLGEWSREPVETLDGATWTIHWAHELVNHINAFAARDDVTIKWLTTWEHSAAKNLSPALGIDGQGWEVLESARAMVQMGWHEPDTSRWWKFKLIKEDSAESPESKVIWIDDDLKYHPDAIEWIRARENDGTGLAVSPSVYVGMTNSDIDDIIRFISD